MNRDRDTNYEFDDEEDKLVVYLDNATIINACGILSENSKFDIYKMLDLESFCQAFLFFDHARTLVGGSFASGFSGAAGGYQRKDRNPEDYFGSLGTDGKWTWATRKTNGGTSVGEDTTSLVSTDGVYDYLLNRKFLRPVVRGAGTVHYHIENIDLFDEIAARAGAAKSIELVRDIFPEGLPWTYKVPDWAQKQWSNEAQKYFIRDAKAAGAEAAAYAVTIGEETAPTDSYPIYYFSVPKEKRRERPNEEVDFGWEINNNRLTDWQSTFVSQTFFYVIEASSAGKSFLGSSVRTPIVWDVSKGLRKSFQSIVQASLGNLAGTARRKITTISKFFGNDALRFVFLPASFCVLDEARSRSDFLPALFRLREQAKFVEFRSWCRRAEQAWRNEDIDEIYNALREIRSATYDLASSRGIPAINGAISHLGDARALSTDGQRRIASDETALIGYCYTPSLALLKDLSGYLSHFRANLTRVEDLLGYKLSKADQTLMSNLSEVQRSLYPPGELDELETSILVAKTEVVMGDKFENISNATIVNRSIVSSAFNKVKQEHGADVANALLRATEEVERSGMWWQK